VLLELAVGGLSKALIERLESDGVGRVIDKRRDATALTTALRAAALATDREHPGVFSRYDVNAGFFEHEGADEIAKILLPGVGPDPRNLAWACACSLGGHAGAALSNPLVVPFATFLGSLTAELGHHDAFRVRLAEVAATRTARATTADERDFVAWLVDRFSHVETAGIGTAKHVQLELADVFVAPRAVRERSPGLKWTTRAERHLAGLAERLRSGEISPEDYEAELDRLGAQSEVASEPAPAPVLEVLRDTDQVVVLGDPGTGKTTLLQYLTLRHALALRDGGPSVASTELGRARLPVYVRAGDFARHRDRDKGLGAYLATFMRERLECPLPAAQLQDLIATHLQNGRCLVLIDGLDEGGGAAERAGVVASISSFTIAQLPRGNRIVCTSRISGYAAAPLAATFTGVRLLEMDDPAIERFLHGYVPAIERREAPEKTAALVERDAQRTIRDLLDAFEHSPGVRRLAANPLLLTALLLVHRTMGNLPERRVDAYKAVVDALGHTWRAKQGVPDSELPDERRLTQWLTLLAEWMHAERPQGSATLRDLLRILGPSWAKLQRQPWDESVLDETDPASTEAGSGILDFVNQVEQHCGLLVERAPGRWGFPHLTFEEFYAGRALAFGRVQDRPAKIRQHLHDARYDEPILLALGLVGRDYAEDIEELFQTTLLADNDGAKLLQLEPSPLEDLLGRDFRFALRALADDIPTAPHLADDLLGRAIDEALTATGRAQFHLYRGELLSRIGSLKSVAYGSRLLELLLRRINGQPLTDEATTSRFVELVKNCAPHPEISERLVEIITSSENYSAAVSAAGVLAGQGELAAGVVERLVEIIASSESDSVAVSAAGVLAGQELAAGVVERLVEIIASSESDYVAVSAAGVLAGQGELAAGVVERLVEIIASSENYSEVDGAARVLAGQGELAAGVVERLVDLALAGSSFAYGALWRS
jgi:hypothetical protein